MNVKSYTYSAIGNRSENQDSLAVFEGTSYFIACIADGVGGNHCGKIASEKSIEFFLEILTSEQHDEQKNLKEALLQTHSKILDIQNSNHDCLGMATTFTACLIHNDYLNGIHVGDSRLCLLRGQGIQQLTEAHTEVARLQKSGKLTAQDALVYPRKNILESAVGMQGTPNIQTFTKKLQHGDRILLTTDGVHSLITKKEFVDVSLASAQFSLLGEQIIQKLQSKTLSDNASFVLLSMQD